MGLADIARPNAATETEMRLVRALDDLFDIGERNGRNHRPEDFLLSNTHVVLYVCKYSRRYEVTFAQLAVGQLLPAGQHPRAFLAADCEIACDTLELFSRNERSDLGLGIGT